jgi:hypothetical protein
MTLHVFIIVRQYGASHTEVQPYPFQLFNGIVVAVDSIEPLGHRF